MLRHKLIVGTLATAGLVVGLASPASAIISSVRANCWTTSTTVSNWTIDDPNKTGLQAFGKARVRKCTAYKSGEGNFTQYYTEAYRYDGGSINVKISFNLLGGGSYTSSAWGSGTDWNASPALGMEADDAVSSIYPFVSTGTLYQ